MHSTNDCDKVLTIGDEDEEEELGARTWAIAGILTN